MARYLYYIGKYPGSGKSQWSKLPRWLQLEYVKAARHLIRCGLNQYRFVAAHPEYT